ncbi:MAG: type II toxin-antitoxin system VapC family toxin [Brevundimonas sp.]|uniref:type II toxin-antitoxin system VapC family toxin n=1 Tax=Brevundimonas sp. TaxID=1871086 RepID=UPI0039189319
MRLLLDTHALIWWMSGEAGLSRPAQAAIRDGGNTVFVSAVSAYEIALKHGMGRLPQAAPLAERFEDEVEIEGFAILPITAREASQAGRMDNAHRDPFDRLLIAQGLLNELTLVSNERLFDSFGGARIW